MKSIYKLLFILICSTALLSSCKKYDEETFNFTPSLSPYLILKSYATKTVTQGNNLTFSVVVRTAFQEPVTVNYQISGGFNLTGTYTLARNTLEGVVTVPIPTGTVPVGTPSVTGTLNLLSATRTGGGVTIGRISPDTEKFSVKVNQ